jgi:hypothetical protein
MVGFHEDKKNFKSLAFNKTRFTKKQKKIVSLLTS